MAPLNPFETKRKKAHTGASSRVREWFVAETKGYYAQGAGTLYYHDLLALFAITWVVGVGGTASILIESIAEQCPSTYRE
jgi:hypothetical protein